MPYYSLSEAEQQMPKAITLTINPKINASKISSKTEPISVDQIVHVIMKASLPINISTSY